MLLNCRRFGSSKCWSTLLTQSEGQGWERENTVLSAQGLDRVLLITLLLASDIGFGIIHNILQSGMMVLGHVVSQGVP